MTKKPKKIPSIIIDLEHLADAPGTADFMLDIMDLFARAFSADGETTDAGAAVQLFRHIRKYLIEHGTTDDGTPIDEAVRLLSWNQLQQIAFDVVNALASVPKAND